MNKKILLVMLLSILTGVSIIAQQRTKERNFKALEIYYETGHYEYGLNRIKEYKRYYIKKNGASSVYTSAIYSYEAMLQAALGNFEEYDKALQSALEAYRSAAPDSTEYTLKALRLLTEAYTCTGQYQKADSILTSYTTTSNNDIQLRDEILRLTFTKISIEYQLGYINKCVEKINNLQAITQKRLVEKDSTIDKKGDIKIAKLSRTEQLSRKELYASVLLLKAELLMANGFVDSAQTLLERQDKWLKKNIGYRYGLLAKSYFLRGQYAYDDDEFKQAQHWFGKASGAAIKYYKTSSPIYSQIQKNYINTLIELAKFEEATQKNNDLDVKILSYYGRRSLAYENNNLIDIEREIRNHSWKKAIRHLEGYLAFKGLPAFHPARLEALKKIYHVYLNVNDNEKAEKALDNSLEIARQLYGLNAPAYHLVLLRQAEFYTEYTDRYKQAEEIYNTSFDVIVKNEISHFNKNYYQNMYGEARLLEVLEKYSKAYTLFNEILLETEKYSGASSVPYAIALEKFANLDITAGNYAEADKKVATSLQIFDKNEKKKYNTDKLHALETFVRLQIVEGKYDQAATTLVKIKKLIKNTEESEEQLYASVEEISLLNTYLGKYQQTENTLQNLIASREKRFGTSHRSLIYPLLYAGNLKLVTGDYNTAEQNILRASSIAASLLSNKSLKYAECLVYQQKLYMAVGDYEKALKSIQQVVDIQTAQFGENHISVGKYLHELALTKYYYESSKKKIVKVDTKAIPSTDGITRGTEINREKKKKATAEVKAEEKKQATVEDMFSSSMKIITTGLGEKSIEYAYALENAAIYQMQSGNLDKAYEYIDRAKGIWVSYFGDQNASSARINYVMGSIMHLKNNYEEALKYYVRSRYMYQTIFDVNHPGYIEAQGKCAQMYYTLGDIKNAIASADETIDKSLTYIDKIFPGLSERGKANYWEKVKNDFEFYKTLAFTQAESYPDMVGKVYNLTLRTKAILLNSSVKVKQKILSSGDTTLIANYEQWLGLKEDIGAAMSMSAAQRKAADIDLAKMEAEVETLEKKLSVSSELFAKNYDKKTKYEWPELKKVLTKKDIALEVVPFRFFNKKFTDTIWYAILSVSAETQRNPDYVVIKNGHELQKKYMKYYRNCIRFQVADEQSYQAYWAPIKQLIKDDDYTIYFSADGVYNQLNLETIRTPEGNFLLNKNKILLIGSTRDLIDREIASKKKAKNPVGQVSNVTLVGNPLYYEQSYQNSKSISQLPGAEVEVNQVNAAIQSAGNIQTQVYLSGEATETIIKELSAPKVFHIATHGFFLEDNEEEELDEIAEKATQNPLLRSGLLLKNGGRLLQNESVYAFNKEEGILTAYEAMNLNFDNTELVVLSACETGLGEVKLGEGVFGLQRSFLVAGSKSIIMSLFKVSDQVTTELMTSFYKKWLGGQPKRTAFVEAKKEIMAKYDNPQYWGAFIMVGLE